MALIRDKVFAVLRKLCPAKLEGKEKGNLISVITSDIELLEVFYAHTISPCAIALLFTIVMCAYIGSFSGAYVILALAAYVTVGIIIPVIVSKYSSEDGMKFRTYAGELGGFVLDSLRGLGQIIQYGQEEKRLSMMNQKTDELSVIEKTMKDKTGTNMSVTSAVIWIFDFAMLLLTFYFYQKRTVGFDGVLLPLLAFMGSFGPVVALENLGSTLSNTFAAGNRVLDILEETPPVDDIDGKEEIAFTGAKVEHVHFSYDGNMILEKLKYQEKKSMKSTQIICVIWKAL